MSNACYLDEYRDAGRFFEVNQSTVEGCINFLALHIPAPAKETLWFADHALILFLFRKLKDGGLVSLPDAMDAMRDARKEAGLRGINDDPLKVKVVAVFKELSPCVVEVNYFCFDGNVLEGGDGSRKLHYVMPVH